MARFKLWSLALGLALAAGASSWACASPITVNVYIYDGATNGTDADATTAATAAGAATAHYEFTYAGLNGISWNDNQSQLPTTPPYNTGGQFVNFSQVVSWSSCAGCGTESEFMNQTLSVPGNSDGAGGGTAMFVLSGSASGTIAGGTINHDDGATFIWGNQTLASSPGETSQISTSVAPASFGTDTPFDLYYVEANGSPSVLDVSLRTLDFSSPAPELSTWAMMMLGFCGVGLMAYGRKSKRTKLRFA